MIRSDRIVFDCNVYFQALISATGPANRLLSLVLSGRASLFASAFILLELETLLKDERIQTKYRLKASLISDFFALLRDQATIVDSVPHVFEFPRDPDDAHYIDLAAAVDAALIVSRDKDLLSLRDPSTVEAFDFQRRFPTLSILTPPEALVRLERV